MKPIGAEKKRDKNKGEKEREEGGRTIIIKINIKRWERQ
jgi:hypothetical protein